MSLFAGQTPWPEGRAFGAAWARPGAGDALIFGGLLSVVFHKNTSRWLLNDLWQHNASDRATPWKLLGGEGVLPRFTAASLPARSVVGRGHVSLLTDSDTCHSATLRHPQCARARRGRGVCH